MKMRPPRLHYGWALSEPDDVLLEVARLKNIPPRDRGKTTTLPKEVRNSTDVEEEEESDEEEGEEYDSEDDSESEACPSSDSMTTCWLRKDALNAVAEELELITKPYIHEVFFPGKDSVYMVAITNNYELRDRALKRRDIDELRKYFKFEGGPMWYLDTYYWTWNSERFWGCKLCSSSPFDHVLTSQQEPECFVCPIDIKFNLSTLSVAISFRNQM